MAQAFVIAPQEFKGSLTATAAAEAMRAGVLDVVPDAEITVVPMSDGGPGLVDAMLLACGGERVESAAHDPLMRPIQAAWGLLGDHTAVVEMAAASGLVLLRKEERDPPVATTFGTGELILAALDRGCERIIVGVGGSATVDGGAGVMQALGARLLDASGSELAPGGGSLARLEHIDLSALDCRLAAAEVRVASDVTNVLFGPQGAAVIFGPQKGASPAAVQALDAALRRFAEVALRDAGIDVGALQGGGAAGGLAAGLVLAARATIESGFDLVADATGLADAIGRADFVVTGEGRLDAQTAFGKTADGVTKLARARGKRVGIIAGSVDAAYDRTQAPFDAIEEVIRPGMPVDRAMRDAAPLVREAAARLTRTLTAPS